MRHLREPIHPNAIYSREQAAELLGISLGTLKRWITNGQIEVSRVAGARRIYIKGASILKARELMWHRSG
jgi:excisionase family DNA binding protein